MPPTASSWFRCRSRSVPPRLLSAVSMRPRGKEFKVAEREKEVADRRRVPDRPVRSPSWDDYREWIFWLAAGIAYDFRLTEVLELVANDLPVANRVHEPRSLHVRDFARFLPGVDQSIERTDSALPEIFQFAPLFRDVDTLRASEVLWCSRIGGSPSRVPLENCVDSAHGGYSAAARDNPLHVFCKDILNRSALEV